MSFSDWRKVKIKDVTTKIGSGSTPRGGSSVYQESGTAFIRSQNVYNNYFDYSGLVYIDDVSADKLKGVTLYPNDVLLNITGDSVARCTIVPQRVLPARVNQHVCIIRADHKNLDYRFLKYVLVNPPMQELMLSYAQTGGTRAALTKLMVEEFEINLPPVDEQKAIANILSSLDEKIELNNQMNKTLEEKAQALFKRWFVDFEFPNENGEPYKSSDGEMVDSELGMIPKGWTVNRISEIIEVRDGTHASPKSVKEGYPLVTSKHMNGDRLTVEQANLISEKDYIEVNKRSQVDTGDILISMIGTVGLVYFVQEEKVEYAIKNVGLFKSSQREEIRELLYLYLKSTELKNYIDARLAGTTQKYISLGELRNIPVILPTDKLLIHFKGLAKSILDTRRNNIVENEVLTKLRDTLLPKLMSGEIRVTDIQK